MSAWSNPAVSLTATAVTGGANDEYGSPTTGTSLNYERVQDTHAVQTVVSALTNSGFIVAVLQGSLDGVNWYQIGATGQYASNGTYIASFSGPAQFVQAEVLTFSESGTPLTATVSVTVASHAS